MTYNNVFTNWTINSTSTNFSANLNNSIIGKSFSQNIVQFGTLTGTSRYIGGVLAPNGKIYGIPYSSSQILEINPTTQTASLFGSVGAGTSKWMGGALGPNGYIYAIPYDSTTILELNPTTSGTTTYGSLSGLNKYSGGITAANGRIYGLPRDSTSVLQLGLSQTLDSNLVLSRFLNNF